MTKSVLLAVLLVSCSHTGVKDVQEQYTQLVGTVTQRPRLADNNHRLFIRLDTASGPKVCLATSEKYERILTDLHERLAHGSEYPVHLFVSELPQGYEEILDGLDYRVHAVKLYDEWAGRYLVVHVDYSPRMDAKTWRTILQRILEKGVDQAL